MAVSNPVSFFILFIICTCFALNPGNNPQLTRQGLVPDQQLRISSMMLHFVMSKGCDYAMAFVKGHYVKHGHSQEDHNHHRDDNPKTCDWKPWMETKCAQYHVPKELCCGLMDCGASRSMEALGAPRDMIDHCNMTDAVQELHGHGRRSSYNRYVDPPSISWMCENFHDAVLFGKREITLDSLRIDQTSNFTGPAHYHLDINDISTIRNTSEKPGQDLNAMSSKQQQRIRRWCKVFSGRINKKYHLNEIKFIRRSAYWLVDIYKAALQHRVPKSYTHGLVGCGMNYAMVAFNVRQWQTVLYKLALK